MKEVRHSDGSRRQYGHFTWYADTPREVREKYSKYALAGEEGFFTRCLLSSQQSSLAWRSETAAVSSYV